MRSALPALLLFLLPAAAAANPKDGSAFSVGQDFALGAQLVRESGSVPVELGAGTTRYERPAAYFYLHAAIGESSPATMLGSQLGLEYQLRLGVTPEQVSIRGVDRTPAFGSLNLAMTLRAYTFEAPARGMVVFLLGWELAAGGAQWWSSAVHFLPYGGVRFAMGSLNRRGLRMEAQYVLVPYAVGASLGDTAVNRTEHRFALTAAIGAYGISLGLGVTQESMKRGLDGGLSLEETGSLSLGAGVEWRQ